MPTTLFLAALLLAPASERPEAPQGVVLIMADDAGVECFGCYGGESYATPRIDALAATGMRFRHAHAQPLCTPSRVKLMTGLSNVRNYQEFSVLRPGERTFAHHFGEAGFATAVVGKWQLFAADHYEDRAGKGSRPEDAGFDQWRLWQVEKLGSRYWKPRWEEDGALHDSEEDVYGPDLFVDSAIEFLRENRDQRFFLYWPSCLPHDPFLPTPHSPDRGAKKGTKHFGPMVEYLDHLVGRIVDELEVLGLREKTLLVFTSDNGTHKSITSLRNGREVRGGKSLTLDTGTHVPFIASRPGVIEPGVNDDLIDLSDVSPTLMEACEIEAPPGLDGRSFAPRLLGEPGAPREWLHCYYDPRPGKEAWPRRRWARDRRYKLYGDGRFVDVTTDPGEERPIAEEDRDADAREAHAKLAGALEQYPRDGAAVVR